MKPRRRKFIYKNKFYSKELFSIIELGGDAGICLFFHVIPGEYRYGFMNVPQGAYNYKLRVGQDIKTVKDMKITFHTGDYSFREAILWVKPAEKENYIEDCKFTIPHPKNDKIKWLMTFHLVSNLKDEKLKEKDHFYVTSDEERKDFPTLIFNIGVGDKIPKEPLEDEWIFRYKQKPNDFYIPVMAKNGKKFYYIVSLEINKPEKVDPRFSMIFYGGTNIIKDDTNQYLYLYHHILETAQS